MKQPFREALEGELKQLIKAKWSLDLDISLERPRQAALGDLSTNAALVVATQTKQPVKELAAELVTEISKIPWVKTSIPKIEAHARGFVNFFISDELLTQEVALIKAQDNYGASNIGQGQKVNVEFLSANPTGPMTLPNGRGGFMGDTLANVLSWLGYEVAREYYINDAGNQIVTLGKSIAAANGLIPDQPDFYQGGYVKDLAWQLKAETAKAAKKRPGRNWGIRRARLFWSRRSSRPSANS